MQLQSRLKTLAPPNTVRWAAPQNIHLTLHFLGDITAAEADDVSRALAIAAPEATPFSLNLGGLGCFPNVRRPRVLWVGLLEESAALVTLHQRLGQSLEAAIGFSPDKRPYSPHLTLGRVKNGIPGRHLRQLSDVIAQYQPTVGKLAELDVEEISFIKSELRPTGVVYSLLGRHKLGN